MQIKQDEQWNQISVLYKSTFNPLISHYKNECALQKEQEHADLFQVF